MKLNVNSIGTKVISTETESKKMGFSEKSQLLMFKLFSKNTYSNPIGSIVREISSNCFDSHKEAGVDKDIVIRINEPNTLHNTPGSISFVDFGMGLSPERIDTIYARYFESTKRDSNDQIGGFGIGSKVPFSYTEVFYVTTVFDKIKYYYIMTMTEEGPKIDLAGVEDTTEGNGTEVCVPFTNPQDKRRFQDEISNQLAYFDKITYLNCGVDNDYKIYQGKHFLYKPDDAPFDRVHVVLGKVAYPLDFRSLGLSEYDYDACIAVKFGIGELAVSMSRESLDYAPESIAKIKSRLKEAMDELASMRDKQYDNITDFDFYLDVRHDTRTIKITDEVNLQLPSAACKNNFEVKFEALHKFTNIIPDNVLFYKAVSAVNGKSRTRNHAKNVTKFVREGKQNMIIVDVEMTKNLSAYLKDTMKGEFYLIRDINSEQFNVRKDLINQHLFNYNIKNVEDEVWQGTFTQYYDFLENWLAGKAIKLSTITIPIEWFEAKKALRKANKEEKQKITIVNVKLSFVDRYNEMDVTSKDLEEAGVTVIYGYRDDKQFLSKVQSFLHDNKLDLPVTKNANRISKVSRYPVVQVRKSDEKVFKGLTKAVHVNDFIKKLGHKFVDVIKKKFIYQKLKEARLTDNNYGFNMNLLGKEIFPKETETIKALKTLMNNGANCYSMYEMEEFFTKTEANLIKEVKAKVEKLVKTQEKFEEATKFFNSSYFNDEKLVKEFAPVIKSKLK